MTAQIIDGKKVAALVKQSIAQQVQQRLIRGLSIPGLAVVLIGNDPASEIYVRNKRRTCESVGIRSFSYDLPDTTTQDTLMDLLSQLNNDSNVHGILVQLPLPRHLSVDTIIEKILPGKDVDGFHPYNIGRLAIRQPTLRSCTPKGVMRLLDSINQPYKGKIAVVIGASNHNGRPMALELLLAGATVTVCHRFTADLAFHARQADILVSAVGRKAIIKGDWIKPGATVIDVGISRDEQGKICGDVEFEVAKKNAAWITPVPGGVGPMTVACLLENTLIAAESQD